MTDFVRQWVNWQPGPEPQRPADETDTNTSSADSGGSVGAPSPDWTTIGIGSSQRLGRHPGALGVELRRPCQREPTLFLTASPGQQRALTAQLEHSKLFVHDLRALLRVAALEIPSSMLVHDTTVAEQLLAHGDESEASRVEPVEHRTARRHGHDEPSAAAVRHGSLLETGIRQRDELRRLGLEAVAELEFDCISAVVDLERTGFGCDAGRIKSLRNDLKRRRTLLRMRLSQLGIEDPARKSEVLSRLAEENICCRNLGAFELVQNARYEPVRYLLEHHRLVERDIPALEYLSQCVESSEDGRLRLGVEQLDPASGQLTMEPPWFHRRLLASKALRRLFVAGPDSELIVARYNASRLRVVAQIAGEENLTQVIDGDLWSKHGLEMARPLSSDNDQPDSHWREGLATALCLDLSPDKLRRFAAEKYLLALTQEQAEELKDEFRRTYPRVDAWQRQVRGARPIIMRSLGGRQHRFSSSAAEHTQRLLAAVQGSCADGVKRSLGLLAPHLAVPDAHFVMCGPDEVVIEAPSGCAETLAVQVQRSMTSGMGEFLSDVSATVDLSVSRDWSAEPHA